MRVGIYIDGFNFYYGGRGLMGGGVAGWRWLDLRTMATAIVQRNSGWTTPSVERIVYCTARISGASNPGGAFDQGIYLQARSIPEPST